MRKLGDEGYVKYPDCSNDFKVVYMSKLTKWHTLSMCNLLYFNKVV